MSRAVSSADQWSRIIREQRASRLSVAAFCRRAGIPQSSFYAWQRRLRDAARFVEVKLPHEMVVAGSEIELRLPGRRCIVIRPGFDRQTLLDLLQALEAGA